MNPAVDNRSAPRRVTGGFTLIELLVVIAIIAILLRHTAVRDLWKLLWHREWDRGAWGTKVQFRSWMP